MPDEKAGAVCLDSLLGAGLWEYLLLSDKLLVGQLMIEEQ